MNVRLGLKVDTNVVFPGHLGVGWYHTYACSLIV
jgi:hypothetical protein